MFSRSAAARSATIGVGDRGDLGVGEADGALRVDAVDDRVEPADRVGAAGGGVVVGGVVERLDDRPSGGVGRQPAAPGLLQRVLGEQRAGADGGVAALLVVPAGDVVAEDAARGHARGGVEVEAGEQRDDGQALHGGTEVPADHRGEAVRLAVEGHGEPLDLLVVLELDLVQPDHLDGDARGAGDPDDAVGVGRVHLLDVAGGDQVAHRGAAVAAHEDAALVGDRDDRRAVRGEVTHRQRRDRAAAGQEVRRGGREEVGERGPHPVQIGGVEPAPAS